MGVMKCCGGPKSGVSIEPVFESREIGDYALSGAQMKFSVRERAKATCTCGWSAVGYMDKPVMIGNVFVGGHFVVEEIS